MNVGDNVVCIDATNHAWFLRVGECYTISSVSEDGDRISLEGMARMWPIEQFERTSIRSTVGDRQYMLDPPRILWNGVWHSAHLRASSAGSALVPDDNQLPPESVVWVEYASPVTS